MMGLDLNEEETTDNGYSSDPDQDPDTPKHKPSRQAPIPGSSR